MRLLCNGNTWLSTNITSNSSLKNSRAAYSLANYNHLEIVVIDETKTLKYSLELKDSADEMRSKYANFESREIEYHLNVRHIVDIRIYI